MLAISVGLVVLGLATCGAIVGLYVYHGCNFCFFPY